MNRPQPVVLAVVLSTFFVGFGGGVVFPILPNLQSVLGITPFLVGLILSANRFTRIVANGPAGSLIDRIGTRTPFVVGLFEDNGGGHVLELGEVPLDQTHVLERDYSPAAIDDDLE